MSKQIKPAPASNPPAAQSGVSGPITHAAIYPPIGVARVGNSPAESFYGPEVPNPDPQPISFYRDSHGALKRQAARFRIYGLNAAGEAVAELTAANAEIEWTVHLANKKAAWYQFHMALDSPGAGSAPPSLLRNSAVCDRKRLTIDPGPKTIRALKHPSQAVACEGMFMGIDVYLGEILTDRAGRLVVLGGRGRAGSAYNANVIIDVNNDGWYDDTSDGPVTAKVTFQGEELPVDPAWVIVAPPNYAPNRKSVRTMWDVMRNTAHDPNDPKAPPLHASFENDIRPIFERLSGLQWVNAGFAAAFGWRGPLNLAEPAMLERLSRNDPGEQDLRRFIAGQFRRFDRDSISYSPWPWLWGDEYIEPPLSPQAFSTLTETQLLCLDSWVDGTFVNDYVPTPAPLPGQLPVSDEIKLAALPIQQQPHALTRAAMEFCVADAFHPGIELTWPMRQKNMYMAPFRIRHAPAGWVEPDYGPQLLYEYTTRADGPIFLMVPGGLTRWLAVPWQADTAACGSSQDVYSPYLPTFWPARVPDQVLTEDQYAIVMDTTRSLPDRIAAFATRTDWLRKITGHYYEHVNEIVRGF
ncbi:MAG TPA: LodA/GoxA family CTQ-dependent oxidase, partial [Bryobacteraceae bacterium]|nr:LodA/GoxA family CTQ-dependent oxidase [Bryobacteraceae bacterium]